MEKIKTLLESEEVQSYIQENQELIQEAEQYVVSFKEGLKTFIMENIQEFIGTTLEETTKNILVFSEVALAQYMAEVTESLADTLKEQEEIAESKINDYI